MALERIHIVSWRDLDDPDAGGSELHINELAKRWAATGHDVTIRTGAVEGGEPIVHRDGYRVVRRGGRLTGLVRSPLSEVLGRQGRRDALVEVWHGINFLSPLWSRGPRVAIAHHVHGEQFRYVLPRPAAAVAEVLETRISPRVYRGTPLVTLSPSTRAGLIDLGHPAGNVHVVTPGVEQRFCPGGEKADHPLVLTVGRLMPQKRVEMLFEAVEAARPLVPDVELVVVGRGPHEAHLRAAAPSWVTFAGHVPDDQLVALYRRAWVVASASVAEGWNMTITEAGACGTPAIASRIAGHRDAVLDGETGLLVDGVPEFSAAFVALLSDASMRNRMAGRAREHSAQYSWDTAASSILNLLSS